MKDYLLGCLSLAAVLTPAFLFFLMAAGGMIHGRLKVEPNSPWITFRDRPARFVAVVISYLAIGLAFAAISVRIASKLLG